jgi:hypothetical protein
VLQFPAPPPPAFAPEQSTISRGFLRYEDLAQDGRLMPIAIPPGLTGLWHDVLVDHPGNRNTRSQGVLPLLTRLTLTSLDQPIRVDLPIESRAGFELAAHHEGAQVARLFMNIWCELRGAAGRIGAREPGPLAPAGRLFAEHTFTRPFAPPGQRRVTRLAAEGYPEIPTARHAYQAPTTAGEPPEGASWIEALTADPAEVAFTLDQTDSNQHVNSLVYIRMFLEAAQRRLAAGGHPLKLRSRSVDIAYRKPCFIGDRVRAHVRLFEHAGTLGAAGFIAAPGDDDKPRCYVRVLFGS